MAPTFLLSAPGKVILFREHAAVYEKPAIAAAISLRSSLLVTTLSKSHHTIKLNFRDIGLNHTWNIDTLPWDIFHQPSKKTSYYSLVVPLLSRHLPRPRITRCHQTAHRGRIETPSRETAKIHVRSATAFLYLFLSLGSPESPGVIYTLRSTIPIWRWSG